MRRMQNICHLLCNRYDWNWGLNQWEQLLPTLQKSRMAGWRKQHRFAIPEKISNLCNIICKAFPVLRDDIAMKITTSLKLEKKNHRGKASRQSDWCNFYDSRVQSLQENLKFLMFQHSKAFTASHDDLWVLWDLLKDWSPQGFTFS